MPNIYYEIIEFNKYKFFLGYTKDHVIINKFLINKSSYFEAIGFLENISKNVKKNLFKSEYGLIIKCFIDGKTRDLTVPVKMYGDDFCIKVWKKIRVIPYGCIKTYDEFFKESKFEERNEKLKKIIHSNKLAVIIPNYRIISNKKTILANNQVTRCYVDLLKNEGHTLTKKGNKNRKINLYNIK